MEKQSIFQKWLHDYGALVNKVCYFYAHDTEDFNDLQNKWDQINSRLCDLEDNVRNIKIDKMKSAKDKLAKDYHGFAAIGLMFALMVPSILTKFAGLWVSLAFSAYFLIAMIMDWNLYRRTKAIDINTMSVAEVAHRAMENRKRHHLYQMILIPCCLMLLGWMLFTVIPSEPYFAWGCGVGAIVGLIFGIRAYLNMMSCYKQMTL